MLKSSIGKISLCICCFLAAPCFGKLYDCFLFFNEFEILKIRLEELSPVVDYFVLVEATETFQGTPKPLYYKNNHELFSAYEDKIIHVVLESHVETSDPWQREAYQRNQILQGLKKCALDDAILISDVDEIPKAGTLKKLADRVQAKNRIYFLSLAFYRFHLNRINILDNPWPAPVLTTYANIRKCSPESLRRQARGKKPHETILSAGWHFSSMGGFEAFIKKVESYSHVENNIPEVKNLKHYADCVEYLPLVPLDETFPSYILKNRKHYKEIGFLIEP